MGRRRRCRNYRNQDDFDIQPSSGRNNHWNRSGGQNPSRARFLGPYAVAGRERTSFPGLEFQGDRLQTQNHEQISSAPQLSPSRSASGPNFPSKFDPAFPAKLVTFKQYLIQSIGEILRQMKQWYPEETPILTGDEMDWQPEVEITMPLPSEVHYIWDHLSTEAPEVSQAQVLHTNENSGMQNGILQPLGGILKKLGTETCSDSNSGMDVDRLAEMANNGLQSSRGVRFAELAEVFPF
jgi:hypothetical protein